jgi:single-stranded DNA-binding protein
MGMYVNQVHIRGRLGSDPKYVKGKSGKGFYRVNVAVSYKDKTDWFPVLVSEKFRPDEWKKGDLVDIVGKASYTSYKKDDETRYSLTIFPISAFNFNMSSRIKELKEATPVDENEFSLELDDFESEDQAVQ